MQQIQNLRELLAPAIQEKKKNERIMDFLLYVQAELDGWSEKMSQIASTTGSTFFSKAFIQVVFYFNSLENSNYFIYFLAVFRSHRRNHVKSSP